jgi:hypothetical protein
MPLEQLSARTTAAALRAQHTLPAETVDVAALTTLLEQAGRRLTVITPDGQRQVTAGWSDETRPVIDQETIVAPVATRSFAIAFAAALGLCWPEASAPPYPGTTVALADVVDAAENAGMSHAWAKGALTNLLAGAGLVDIDDGQLRLGPAVAALTPAQVSAFRRIHDRLPTATDDDDSDEQDDDAEVEQ